MFDYLITQIGNRIYPSYLNKEDRAQLRNEIGDNTDYMYCSCRRDQKLYYRISVDLRFIPCHQNYEHNSSCCRYKGTLRNSSYIKNEDGSVSTVYLKFNPANFTIPTRIDNADASSNIPNDESDMMSSSDFLPAEQTTSNKTVKGEFKEPFSSLAQFIRNINFDTYMERLLSNKKVLSADYFISSLYAHLKKVYISPMRRSIRELDIAKDGYKFFYAPLTDIKYGPDSNSITINFFDKDLRYFVFEGTMQNTIKEYKKYYGEEPDVKKDNIMVAGFLYQRTSKMGRIYKTPGRLHFFKVNSKGIYCINNTIKEILDNIFDSIHTLHLDNSAKVYLNVDDTDEICTICLDGCHKYLTFYYDVIPDGIEINENCIAIECSKQTLSPEHVLSYLKNLK